MAIYSSVPPPSQQPSVPVTSQSASAIDIEAWTVSALQSLTVSPSARGTGVSLSIPLDDSRDAGGVDATPSKSTHKPRREPLRRDSQKRREALLKGKEGSRRRQRWENGTLYISHRRHRKVATSIASYRSEPGDRASSH